MTDGINSARISGQTTRRVFFGAPVIAGAYLGSFNGTVIPDHIPQLVGDGAHRSIGTAYCIAYMRALLYCANQELG